MIKSKNKKPSEPRPDQGPPVEQHRPEPMDTKGILGRLDTLTNRGVPDPVGLVHEIPEVLALRRDLGSGDSHAAAPTFLQKQAAEELGLDLRRMAAFHLAISRPLSPGIKMEAAEDLSIRDRVEQNSPRPEERDTSVYASRSKISELACSQVSVKVSEVLSCSIDKGFGVTPDKMQPHVLSTDAASSTAQHRTISHSPEAHQVKEQSTPPSADPERTPTLTDSATSPSPPTCLRIPTVYGTSKHRSPEHAHEICSEKNHESIDFKASPIRMASNDNQVDVDSSVDEDCAISDSLEGIREHSDTADMLQAPESPCSSDIDV